MLLIRRFEERAGQLYGLGLIGGFCHLYIGQEAVAVGLQSAMTVGKDSVITGYRDHGHMLAYGIDPKLIMAELTGRFAGISKGKGGSMHMFSVEHGFYGGHGIVGAQVSLGTGLGFKHQYLGDGGVCLTYFGDGAANQGQVYESFNMAELWKLPVIYAIENNEYAMGTVGRAVVIRARFLQARREPPHSRHPGRRNGRAGGARRGRRWRSNGRGSGKGPIILEFKTYRYRGHSMSDPAKYRTREEVQDYREHNDPIDHAAKALEKLGVSEEELKAIDKQIKDIVVEAAKFAEDAPEPDAERTLHRRAGGELLMTTELTMPALSPTMEEGTLAKWLVKEGDDGQVGRHPGRDRDRQGDDGVRGGRRGDDRQDPGARRQRRGEGRHADRGAGGRGRGCERRPLLLRRRRRRPTRRPRPPKRRSSIPATRVRRRRRRI